MLKVIQRPRLGIAATLTGAVLLAFASASADYDACMGYCLDEYGFSHCHPVCVGSESGAGETGSAKPSASVAAEECYGLTLDQKIDAILIWIEQHYDPAAIAIYPTDDEEDVFEVDFDVYPSDSGLYCVALVTFDDECGVNVVEFVEGHGC